MKLTHAIALALVLSATPLSMAFAKKDAKPFVVVNEEVGVPVFAYDITDRPYKILGEVKAGVRKATVFSKEVSQAKIYRNLWERGEKMKADAIVNARYGDSRVTLMSWGQTDATGIAIKFLTPEEIAAGAVPQSASALQAQTEQKPAEPQQPSAPSAPAAPSTPQN
jgi:hypothetical protein